MPLAEEVKTKAFWTQMFESVDRREAKEHEEEHNENLIENEILDSYVPR